MSQLNDLSNLGKDCTKLTDQTMVGTTRLRKPIFPVMKGSLTARLWRLLGITLIVSGVICLLYLRFLSDWIPSISHIPFRGSISVAVASLLFYMGSKCRIRGKRLLAIPLSTLAAIDNRKPVLYLRSFGDDNTTSRMALANWIHYLFRGPSFWDSPTFDVLTEEEQLAKVLSDIGPFVAIGRPGEKLPLLGSTRVYLSDDEWQPAIVDIMPRSSLIVFRAGKTAGLRWELQTASRLINLERLIILIPFNKSRYEKFREEVEAYLGCKLPEYNGRKNLFSSLRGIIYFEPDRTAHFAKLSSQQKVL